MLALVTTSPAVPVIQIPKPEPVERADRPRPALIQPDFIREAEYATVHDGKPYWVCSCRELIEGRWEGFASMRDRLES